MTYTEKELDQFLHGISLSLLSKKSAQHWRYDEETAKEIEWLEALERKVRADKADHKTENSSEKPNNCEYAENPSGDVWECGCFPDTYCEHQIYDMNPDGTINIVECRYEPKTEPTISKMEQVEDETQTQLTARCLNCNNAKACKEKHWEGCVYEPKDEKTCETCRHWKYIAHEWQCEACKCQGYEPKDEPQTIRCPKCGRTDYIRDMEKDMGIKGSRYKYKCINCNTYIKDEPQTEREGE